MALILNIDTALNSASICLAENDTSIAFAENTLKNQHAVWLHQAIKDLLQTAKVGLADLDAIAVSNGPGSYTGLRIGLSTAKGLCYTLQIPLICLSTLTVIASAVKDVAEEFICPMIDARRMEVFTAVFDKNLNIIESPKALVLSADSFSELLTDHKILFTGDGMLKFKNITTFNNSAFMNHNVVALNMLELSFRKFNISEFADLAYAEPFYVKPVYTK